MKKYIISIINSNFWKTSYLIKRRCNSILTYILIFSSVKKIKIFSQKNHRNSNQKYCSFEIKFILSQKSNIFRTEKKKEKEKNKYIEWLNNSIKLILSRSNSEI